MCVRAGARLPAFTGVASSVYGNSSRETGRTAQEHCGTGLPAPWAEHTPCAVLWLTGGLLPCCLEAIGSKLLLFVWSYLNNRV